MLLPNIIISKLHTNSLNNANKAPPGNLSHGDSDVNTVKHQVGFQLAASKLSL